MKIERAVVEEFIGSNGIYAKPQLRLSLDVEVLPRSTPIHINDGAVLVHGRKFSFLADIFVSGFSQVEGPSKVNTYFRGRPWFPVTVNFFQAEWQWYIPLDRARKELAKHQIDWEIVTDDAAAVKGELVWRLREKELTCRAKSERTTPSEVFCGAPASTEIRRLDYYIPLCDTHHRQLTLETSRKRGKR